MVIGDGEIGNWQAKLYYYSYLQSHSLPSLHLGDELYYTLLVGHPGFGARHRYARILNRGYPAKNLSSFVVKTEPKPEPAVSYRKIDVTKPYGVESSVRDTIARFDPTGSEAIPEVAKIVYRYQPLRASMRRLAKQVHPQVESALRSIRTSTKGTDT